MACLELLLTLAALPAAQDPLPHAAAPMVVVVVGAPGEEAYREVFQATAERWRSAAEQGGAQYVRVDRGADDGVDDRTRLQELLAGQRTPTDAPLWLVLIGHGTFDGERARFNLRGPDVRAQDLATWLDAVPRPQAVLVCASSSGPFVNRLSKLGRVIVTATRSGSEVSYSRFGGFLSLVIGSIEADLDGDRQVSLLEAFRFASARTEEWYAGEARLASEHALLDDNGDGLGASTHAFTGVRATHAPPQGDLPDGTWAHRWHLIPSAAERALPSEVRQQRDTLEAQIETLRAKKAELDPDAYYAALEGLMLELARLYR